MESKERKELQKALLEKPCEQCGKNTLTLTEHVAYTCPLTYEYICSSCNRRGWIKGFEGIKVKTSI